MKKKVIFIAILVAILIVMTGVVYVWQGSEMVEVQTHSFLLDRGYTNADIATIEVKHSFMNLILSYDEWTSTVVFMDEPTVQYHFTWKDHVITSAGASGESADKNALKQFHTNP